MYEKDSIVIDAFAKELRLLLKDGDLSLATRLMLDYLTDLGVGGNDAFDKALAIRAAYNQSEELKGTDKEAARKQLEKQMVALLDSLAGPATVSDGPATPQFLRGPSRFTGVQSENPTLIFEGKGIGKRYGSMNFELANINIDMKAGELTGIVGANGNGKTTLLRIIAGDLAHSKGQIAFPGIPADNTDWYSIKQHIAFIPQNLQKWQGLLRENLHFSAANHGIFGKENEEMVAYIIHRLGLTKYQNARWGDISTGYKLRFELARALVWHPRLLVLDEPLANLDINTKLLFMQDLRLIANIRKFPISVILSSQQLHEIESVVDNIIFLEDGKSIYNGPVKDFGQDRQENSFELAGNFTREELYGLLQALQDISIEDTGQSFVVHTPINVEAAQLLTMLASHKLEYFRDISKSTRKLFKNK